MAYRKRKQGAKQTAGLILTLALVVGVTACGDKDAASETMTNPKGSSGETKGPVTIQMAYDTGNTIPSTTAESNEALKYLEQKLGIRFELTVNSANIHRDKIRVQIASGDMPDVFAWKSSPMDDFIVSLIKAGAVVPLDDYIDQYPNLKKQKEYQLTKYKEKLYAITAIRNPVASGSVPLIRQDWLNNLGLKAPTTVDELYTAAKAFTLEDPDKNGKKDTYGIQLGFSSNSFTGATGIQHAFGLTGDKWVRQDGKVVPAFATPEFRAYLAWMQQAFKEGLLDPDFGVSDGKVAESNVVSKGQAGMFFNFLPRINDFEDNFKKKDPNAQLVAFEPIHTADGKQIIQGRVNYAGLFVSKQAAADPDKLKKIFEWLDFGASEEGLKFRKYGAEGIHHTVKDGKIELNKDAFAKDVPDTFVWTTPMESNEEQNVNKKNTPETQKLVIAGNMMAAKFIVLPDPLHFAFSPTGAKYDNEANAFINNTVAKVIMGSVSLDEWDGVIKQWYERFEGEKWMDELAETVK